RDMIMVAQTTPGYAGLGGIVEVLFLLPVGTVSALLPAIVARLWRRRAGGPNGRFGHRAALAGEVLLTLWVLALGAGLAGYATWTAASPIELLLAAPNLMFIVGAWLPTLVALEVLRRLSRPAAPAAAPGVLEPAG